MPFALSDMSLTSTAFEHSGPIPRRHSQDGDDLSPPLRWQGAPEGTRSFALICHDPDAPLVSANGTYGFVHWVLYNIPASTREIAEGDTAYTAGINDAGSTDYKGPKPPEGHGTHAYYFWVLALDTDTQLPPGLTLWDLLQRVEPHVLAMNRLVGTYQRN